MMSKSQFFTAKREKGLYESHTYFACPAQSGLFSEAELKEFEKYFEMNDTTVLTVNYNTDQRSQMNVGKLDFVFEKNTDQNDAPRVQFDFKMTAKVDLHSTPDFDCGVTDAESCFLDEGDNYLSVYSHLYKEIKTKKVTKKAKKNNLVCTSNSIRVFRIHVTGSSSEWDYGKTLHISLRS